MMGMVLYSHQLVWDNLTWQRQGLLPRPSALPFPDEAVWSSDALPRADFSTLWRFGEGLVAAAVLLGLATAVEPPCFQGSFLGILPRRQVGDERNPYRYLRISLVSTSEKGKLTEPSRLTASTKPLSEVCRDADRISKKRLRNSRRQRDGQIWRSRTRELDILMPNFRAPCMVILSQLAAIHLKTLLCNNRRATGREAAQPAHCGWRCGVASSGNSKVSA